MNSDTLSGQSQNSQLSNEAVANKSVATTMPNVVQTSEPISLEDDGSRIKGFKIEYDRIFSKFEHKLMNEYEKLRTVYSTEYQANF